MALPLRSSGRLGQQPWICARCTYRIFVSNVRQSSTDSPAPPLLAKLKGDLKAAMKAKDTPRLNVLRAVISDFNNASKTASPVTTDMQMLTLLKKRRASSETAASEALAANRADLQQKQQAEMEVMDEYAGTVKLMSEGEIQKTVSDALEQLKSTAAGAEMKAGNVLKELFKTGGPFDGKAVEKSQVVKAVNNFLTGKS